VHANDEWDYDYNEPQDLKGPMIGGTYVIEAFNDAFPQSRWADEGPKLTVMLASGGDEALYRGTAHMSQGSQGYSSLTPGSGPDMWIGGAEEYPHPHSDLHEKLVALDGQTVHLRIDDGPEKP
jgi:hypothetical protein